MYDYLRFDCVVIACSGIWFQVDGAIRADKPDNGILLGPV